MASPLELAQATSYVWHAYSISFLTIKKISNQDLPMVGLHPELGVGVDLRGWACRFQEMEVFGRGDEVHERRVVSLASKT